MAQDYNEYLAANVLNEQQFVSYRLLSRALKVHANLAKQMLYEFHRKQNSKKPGSVHATYLITGIRRIEPPAQPNGVHKEDGEDTVMQSSPILPSSSALAPDDAMEEARLLRTVLLVKEEDLETAKNTFDTISSIHIYSLEATSINDLHVLTECNRKVGADYSSEDPLEAWKQYGTIQNPNVKRRKRGTAPPPPPPAAKPVETKKSAAPALKQKDSTDSKPASKTATPEPEKTPSAAKPAPTKRQTSDIFKSFSKAKAKPKSEQNSASASPAPQKPTEEDKEDIPMTGFSDDDMDDEDPGDAVEEDVKVPEGKSKKDREAELKAMMDAEDEEMEDADTSAESPEAEPEPEAATEKVEEPKGEPNETVTVENGRRRGRRRVMKKKTVKDEEGYLVTKEEPAWESFSEDEPAPKKIKVPPASTVNSGGKSGAKKGGASGGKPGQGNIMSFFSKK